MAKAGPIVISVESATPPDDIRKLILKAVANERVLTERWLTFNVRPKPTWMPEPVWGWLLGKLIFVTEEVKR